MAVIIPIKKAAYSPVSGVRPARIAKDKDSGIMVIATVKPARISFLKFIFLSVEIDKKECVIVILYRVTKLKILIQVKDKSMKGLQVEWENSNKAGK